MPGTTENIIQFGNMLETAEGLILDPGNGGAVGVTKSGTCVLVTAGAETRTLAAPSFLGQEISFYFLTDGGDCVITCASGLGTTATNAANYTVMTFADVYDNVILKAIYKTTSGTLGWIISQYNGAVIS